jgi:cytochrome c peroxidase
LENYSGGGGAHNVAGHIALTATPANGWSACVTCHYGTDTDPNHMSRNYSKPSNINVTVDPKYKFNAALQIKYSSNQVDPPLRNSTGTCSNVSCHFQPTPKWSTER